MSPSRTGSASNSNFDTVGIEAGIDKVLVIQLLLFMFLDILCWIFSSYCKKSVLLFEVLFGLIVFYYGILSGVCSLFMGLTIVGLNIVVFLANLSSMASWSDDLEEVEAS